MRPTKLSQQLQATIVEQIKAGNYIETAAAYAGINKSTLYDWLKRGGRELQRLAQNPRAKIKKSEAPFVEFSNAVEQAQAFAESRDVVLIANAAKTDWRAAAWRLERKFPKKWGRQERVEVSGPEGGPIETKPDLSKLSDEELAVLYGLVSKAAADPSESDGYAEGDGDPEVE